VGDPGDLEIDRLVVAVPGPGNQRQRVAHICPQVFREPGAQYRSRLPRSKHLAVAHGLRKTVDLVIGLGIDTVGGCHHGSILRIGIAKNDQLRPKDRARRCRQARLLQATPDLLGIFHRVGQGALGALVQVPLAEDLGGAGLEPDQVALALDFDPHEHRVDQDIERQPHRHRRGGDKRPPGMAQQVSRRQDALIAKSHCIVSPSRVRSEAIVPSLSSTSRRE